jgi:hypothetical protein
LFKEDALSRFSEKTALESIVLHSAPARIILPAATVLTVRIIL